MRDELLID